MKPIIIIRNCNSFLETPHFKIEGIPTVRNLLKKGDFLCRKDTYLILPVHSDHERMAPWTFTKLLRPVVMAQRGTECHLHRRYSPHEPVRVRTTSRVHDAAVKPTRESGVPCELQEV